MRGWIYRLMDVDGWIDWLMDSRFMDGWIDS